jgi:hypothetical protein
MDIYANKYELCKEDLFMYDSLRNNEWRSSSSLCLYFIILSAFAQYLNNYLIQGTCYLFIMFTIIMWIRTNNMLKDKFNIVRGFDW